MKMSKDKKCYVCGKSLSKNEIGLSKKLIGRATEKFYCLDCLADELEVTTDELQDKIEEFKDEGCTLFE
jgi:predicted Ser/Thr protein kinase